ncbi:hypothetical protein BCO_0900095 (plasmid) [Borrelia coriaceae ATCC 43381]|uniref:Uncharacterized protein n=1 Tax=Borrelia coriaceae ATCC 43381 TaxID=1408429 RepID=W5SWG1_9SPIR|nr:hypothetical protein BCO_0900095 [Borrelia coriaceae ATCC 43381]
MNLFDNVKEGRAKYDRYTDSKRKLVRVKNGKPILIT